MERANRDAHHAEMDAIRQHRKRLGLTLEALAAMVDCSPPYLSQLERGANNKTNPSAAVMARIAAALGVPVSALTPDDGFGESMAAPFRPAAGRSNDDLRQRLAALTARARRPDVWRLAQDCRGFALLAGDLLVIDLAGEAADGDLVIANAVDEQTGDARTLVRRKLGDLLLGDDPNAPDAALKIDAGNNPAVLGPVVTVARL